MSTNRVIVDASIHDAYVDKLLERVKMIPVGDPNLEDTVIGPIINQSQVKNISRSFKRAASRARNWSMKEALKEIWFLRIFLLMSLKIPIWHKKKALNGFYLS